MAVREAVAGESVSRSCCLNAVVEVDRASMNSCMSISDSNGDWDCVDGRCIGGVELAN